MKSAVSVSHSVFTDGHDRHSSPKRGYSVCMFFANQQLKKYNFTSYFLQQQKSVSNKKYPIV